MAVKVLKGCGVLKVDNSTILLDDSTNVISVASGETVPTEATATAIGGVLQASNQADSTATTIELLVADFNALLAKLKLAGIMVAE